MPAFLALLLSAQVKPDLAKHIYPIAKPIVCPKVEVDATDFPEGKEWIDTAKVLVETWFTTVCGWLGTDGRDPATGEKKGEAFQPPKVIHLVIKKEISAPAYTTGGTITVNGKWITAHPDDLGMMIHELTHVVQHYGGGRRVPGWLVEGIADYIRWWRYEPELHATSGRTKIDPAKSNYTDSYRTTALWLAWCGRKYNMALVPSLDKAMRDREDPMPIFEKLTGKTAPDLWKEFVAGWKG